VPIPIAKTLAFAHLICSLADRVKFWPAQNQPARVGQRVVAALMLLLWLGIFSFAACPQLHHLLHSDSHQAGHQCLVTQIQHQPLLAGLAHFLVPTPSCFEVPLVHCTDALFLSSSDYRISPSRAPPQA
jgi:hypothetical protein